MHLRESVTVILLVETSPDTPVSLSGTQCSSALPSVCFLLGPGTWDPSPRPQEAALCLQAMDLFRICYVPWEPAPSLV